MDILKSVPTNIITGFLGTGKTTAILHLLKTKPETERWAVLVNEFGEMGIDGALLSGQFSENKGVFVREVPGGCMCCAAGVPMQVALNQLLATSKPQRLLIEPTGLGHPKEVIKTLSAPHYQTVLSLGSTITLVDARCLQDSRYTTNDTFNQQIEIADTVVGNKLDLYGAGDKERLKAYLDSKGYEKKPLYFTRQGELDWQWLTGTSGYLNRSNSLLTNRQSLHQDDAAEGSSERTFPAEGYYQLSSEGEGVTSVGWCFSPEMLFDRKRLLAFMSGLKVDRLKAVFITPDGILGYNKTPDSFTESALDESPDSRIEIIADKVDAAWEEAILSCRC